MRILGIVALGAAVLLSGCAIQRAQEAQDARAQMVGMSKEQVLACMGAPVNKAAEGMTEVWAYNSGNGMTVTDASYGRFGGTAVSSSRFCNINVVMNKGQVAAVPAPPAVFLPPASSARTRWTHAFDASSKPNGRLSHLQLVMPDEDI